MIPRRVNGAAILAAAAVLAMLQVRADCEEPRFAPEVADEVRAALATYNTLSDFPLPSLDDDQLQELLDGDVVRMRWKQPVPVRRSGRRAVREEKHETSTDRHRGVALYLMRQPRLHVWLAALDSQHTKPSRRLSEARVGGKRRGASRWYQYMRLPWPVRDRHWVIDVQRSTHVAEATNDLIWEQAWYLVENGERWAYEVTSSGRAGDVTLDDARAARYLEANTGAWAMFDLAPNLTLFTYQVTVVLGGWLPENLTVRFAMRELKGLCEAVEAKASRMQEHYRADHEPIHAGNGRLIAAPLKSEASVGSGVKRPD